MAIEPERMYKLSEASEILQIPLSSLKRWAKERRIPGTVMMGNQWRISGANLQRFMENGTTGEGD